MAEVLSPQKIISQTAEHLFSVNLRGELFNQLQISFVNVIGKTMEINNRPFGGPGKYQSPGSQRNGPYIDYDSSFRSRVQMVETMFWGLESMNYSERFFFPTVRLENSVVGRFKLKRSDQVEWLNFSIATRRIEHISLRDFLFKRSAPVEFPSQSTVTAMGVKVIDRASGFYYKKGRTGYLTPSYTVVFK